MLGCFLNQGYVAGSCEGFMSVCCAPPAIGRRFRENHVLDPVPLLPAMEKGHRGLRPEHKQTVTDYGRVVNDPQCGRPITATRRVLDGEPAGFGSFPWQALIRVGKGKCGGVLVNRLHAVTAGHCVKNKALNTITVTLG